MPGLAAAGWAISRLATGDWRPGWTWLAVLAAAIAAEALPVRIEGVAAGTTSLATVFIAAGAARLGPEASATVGALAMFLGHFGRDEATIRRIYNPCLYGVAGLAAGLAELALPDSWRYGGVAATAFYLADVGLLTLVVSASGRQRWSTTATLMFRTTFLPFVALASLTVTLCALWIKSGWFVLSLGPPLLLLIALQQRDAVAREKQRELDRAKDEFLATTSHELRTPLASVYGAAQTLDQRPELDDGTRRQVTTVLVRQAARLTELVEDVLWAARLGAGRVNQRLSACLPAVLIDEVVDAEVAAGRGERIRRGPVTDEACRADAEHLQRILVNLVENALTYSPGAVEVAAVRARRAIRFLVDDEGEGIPEADAERVFERFVRLDPAMERNRGGTGLGLYICRSLAQGMGGRLWVERSPLGGARFALELPAA